MSPRTVKGNKSITSAVDATFDPNAGFICDVTGTLSYRLRHDAALKQVEVVSGTFYDLDIAQFDVDLSEASQVVTVFFRVT